MNISKKEGRLESASIAEETSKSMAFDVWISITGLVESGNEVMSSNKNITERRPSESKPRLKPLGTTLRFVRKYNVACTTSLFPNGQLRDEYFHATEYFIHDLSSYHPICLGTIEPDECRMDEVASEGDDAPRTLSAGTSL